MEVQVMTLLRALLVVLALASAIRSFNGPSRYFESWPTTAWLRIGRVSDRTSHTSPTTHADVRQTVIAIVTKIKRADYEGDRDQLKTLYDELSQFADDKTIGAKVHYWRGFAMWRRAFNGTNATPEELEQNMTLAVKDF